MRFLGVPRSKISDDMTKKVGKNLGAKRVPNKTYWIPVRLKDISTNQRTAWQITSKSLCMEVNAGDKMLAQ